MSICSFISNLPKEFPWEYGNEPILHAEYIKRIKEAISAAAEGDEIDAFCCGMSNDADLDFAESVLCLKNKYPKIKLICVVDSAEQNKDLNKQEIERYNAITEKADERRLLSDFAFIDKSEQLIAAWNGQESGPMWDILCLAIQREPIHFIRLNDIKEDAAEPNGRLKRELREAEESVKKGVFTIITYTMLIKELIAGHPDPIAAFKNAIKTYPAFVQEITNLADILELNIDEN